MLVRVSTRWARLSPANKLPTFCNLRVHSLQLQPPDGGTTKCRTLINPSWLPPSWQNCSRRKTKLPPPPPSPTSVGSLEFRSIRGQKRLRPADYPVTTINGNYCRSFTCKLCQVKIDQCRSLVTSCVCIICEEMPGVYRNDPCVQLCYTFPQFLCLRHVTRVWIWT